MPQEHTTVIVIGAGWAGISAAKQLQDQGVDCVVLEGRDRIGGRCFTFLAEDGATPVELGAAWIHGKKNNPMMHIAEGSGINMSIKKASYESRIMLRDNEDGSSSEVNIKDFDKMYEYLMEGKGGFFNYVKKKQDDVDDDWTMKKAVDAFLNKINATDEQRIFMYYICDTEIEQEYAASLEELSMWYYDSDEEMKGGDVTLANDKDGGYTAVLNHYAESIRSCIQLQSKVTAIDYSDDDGVCVTYEQDGDSKKMVACTVICTVPLGVLKAKVIDFKPELPNNKQLAIDRMGMGVLNKCMLLFDDDAELPWPKNKEWIERIVTGQDPEKPQGLWTEFVCLQPSGGKRIVCGFTVGKVARELEAKSDQEIQDSVMSALKAMFAPKEVPEPCQYVISKWGQDEFAYGSYSFNAYGGKHIYHRILKDSVDDKLFFAGEACHSDYFQTTHGAYLTGIQAAKDAAKHCDGGKKTPAKLFEKIFDKVFG